jgi:serine/threonine-protein kinase
MRGALTYALVSDGMEAGRADWQPIDQRITLLEWLLYGVSRVPALYAELRAGNVPRGFEVADQSGALEVQRPFLFDFAAADVDLVLATLPATPPPEAAPAAEPDRNDPSQVPLPVVKVNPRDKLPYVFIPPGKFRMGCSPNDADCGNGEMPAHAVTIDRGFWIGQTPVTVGAYKRFAAAANVRLPEEPVVIDRKLNPAWSGKSEPMVNVSWVEAEAFCRSSGMRLPTEAEWEFAARGTVSGRRYGALDQIAWYANNSGLKPLDSDAILREHAGNFWALINQNGNGAKPVGLKLSNAYSLLDMLGNVTEWVGDWFSGYEGRRQIDPLGPGAGQFRVVRGFSWASRPVEARVSARLWLDPNQRNAGIGFRCAGGSL